MAGASCSRRRTGRAAGRTRRGVRGPPRRLPRRSRPRSRRPGARRPSRPGTPVFLRDRLLRRHPARFLLVGPLLGLVRVFRQHHLFLGRFVRRYRHRYRRPPRFFLVGRARFVFGRLHLAWDIPAVSDWGGGSWAVSKSAPSAWIGSSAVSWTASSEEESPIPGRGREASTWTIPASCVSSGGTGDPTAVSAPASLMTNLSTSSGPPCLPSLLP
mmetsp:Transcript_12182/g.27807  ORF Transcript_12182/g.27807 Transcript_12182/m.27807 type:complete len:214 (-) Transcript_12182:258-899(-)